MCVLLLSARAVGGTTTVTFSYVDTNALRTASWNISMRQAYGRPYARRYIGTVCRYPFLTIYVTSLIPFFHISISHCPRLETFIKGRTFSTERLKHWSASYRVLAWQLSHAYLLVSVLILKSQSFPGFFLSRSSNDQLLLQKGKRNGAYSANGQMQGKGWRLN